MPGTFAGIEIAGRALRVNQTVVDVIGHNIANVNTPGYSRQNVQVSASDPYTVPSLSNPTTPGQIGTGVQITSVLRARDAFVEQRLGDAAGEQGRLNKLRDTLLQAQSAFSEPGTNGLSSLINSTFNTFQQVSADPENIPNRTLLTQQAQTLAARFHTLNNDLSGLNSQIASQVKTTITQVNDIAKQVASLNDQIRQVTALGDHPNDLADKRDQLIQQLGTLIGAKAVPETDANGRENGAVRVVVGGLNIVEGKTAFSLPSDFTAQGSFLSLTDGKNSISIQSGEVVGLIQASQEIENYRSNINTVASNLITSVNNLHQTGYGLDGQTGRPFFTGTDAATIDVDAAIKADPKTIAAATAPVNGQPVATGNGDNARAIADLVDTPLIGTQTLGGYYSATVTQIGSDVKNATDSGDYQKQVIQQLQNQRNSVSGVSLDEELTQMLQYQRSYQAAARLLNTFDSMLETVINSVGR